MYKSFLHIAGLLNRQLSATPLLYGSLGLERRLSVDLNAEEDGYRKDIKNKQDHAKISLIKKTLALYHS